MSMQDSFYYADFPASLIAERVSTALMTLPAKTLLELTDSKKILISKTSLEPFQTLTYRNLRINYLDDYLQACGMSLRFALFGSEGQEQTHYSDFDAVVLPLINAMQQELLPSVAKVVTASFNNPKFQIQDLTPSGKLVSLLLMGGKAPKVVPQEELWKYHSDINTELTRFRKAGKKERCILHIDYIPDLCSYCRVSPHWVFSSRLPCCCDTCAGDDFFDVFCLLSRQHQIYALATLLNLCPEAEEKLAPETLLELRRIISEEGRVVQ